MTRGTSSGHQLRMPRPSADRACRHRNGVGITRCGPGRGHGVPLVCDGGDGSGAAPQPGVREPTGGPGPAELRGAGVPSSRCGHTVDEPGPDPAPGPPGPSGPGSPTVADGDDTTSPATVAVAEGTPTFHRRRGGHRRVPCARALPVPPREPATADRYPGPGPLYRPHVPLELQDPARHLGGPPGVLRAVGLPHHRHAGRRGPAQRTDQPRRVLRPAGVRLVPRCC